MPAKGFSREAIWTAAGILALAVSFLLVTNFRRTPGPAAQLALQAKRLEIVNAMRLALAAASEAQNSAVISASEQDSELFAGQARAANQALQRSWIELEELTRKRGDQHELELMERVAKSLRDFGRIDKQLIDMAIQNSNRKAYDLAFGPATNSLQQLDTALAQIAAAYDNSAATDVRKIQQLVSETRIRVLRIQVFLLPHIAAETDQKMDELEAQIAREEQAVREGLGSLDTLLPSGDSTRVAAVTALYADFDKVKSQIIQLSRQNTDVKAAAIALNEKRKAMIACQDALAVFANAIHTESIQSPVPARR